jgi:hypothetical protein
MIIHTLSKQAVDAKPYWLWNAFVDLLAMEDYKDLSPIQRAAQLVFWYESEVQNGGHLQFFENRGVDYLEETIQSLGLLGAGCQREVLVTATQLWLSKHRPPKQTVEEYCEVALDREFAELDKLFDQCDPPLQQRLEEYLSNHQSEFVAIV